MGSEISSYFRRCQQFPAFHVLPRPTHPATRGHSPWGSGGGGRRRPSLCNHKFPLGSPPPFCRFFVLGLYGNRLWDYRFCGYRGSSGSGGRESHLCFSFCSLNKIWIILRKILIICPSPVLYIIHLSPLCAYAPLYHRQDRHPLRRSWFTGRAV